MDGWMYEVGMDIWMKVARKFGWIDEGEMDG